MGSVDIPPFLREQQKKQVQATGDIPPFLKKKEEESASTVSSSTPSMPVLSASASAGGGIEPTPPSTLVSPLPSGLIEIGNINLNDRPVVKNKDGSISTVRSISIGTGKGEVLIPTISDDGKSLSEKEAISQYKKTGKHLGIFRDIDSANSYAEQLHNAQDARYRSTPVESPFEFEKYRNKKVPLPANIPRATAEVSKVLSKVENGSVAKEELAELYTRDYGKPIVEELVQTYAPQLGTTGWETDVEKWDELSKTIKTKNRTNASIQQENYIKGVDQKLTEAFQAFKTAKVNVSGGTGGAAVNVNSLPFPAIDINNPWEFGRVIKQIETSDDIVDANGNKVPGKKQELIQYLNDKAKYFTAKQGVDSDVLALGNKVTEAVARSNMNREMGESIPTEEFAKNDKLNEEHFKIGLSFLKNVQPGQYKNIVRVIDEGKQIPDDDYRNVAEVGQEIYNQQVFFGAATNPELIDKETNLDYTTYSDKKAQYAAVIGERIKAAGFKNWREYPEEMIKKYGADLPNKKIIQDLANEEKMIGYDAIPKSGVIEGALVQGINQPFDGIKSTFQSFSESPAETYIRSKKLDEGSAQKVVGPDGQVSAVLPSDRGNILYDAVRGLGQFIPQVLLTKGIGGGANSILGTTGKAASAITNYGGTAVSTFLQSYGDSYADYLQKTGDVATARLGGTIDGGVSAAFELILPDVKIADKAFAGLKSGLSNNLIDLVKKGGDPATLANKARPFVQKFVQNTLNIAGQEVLEEDGTALVDYITESIFSPQTAKDRELGKELLETTKATVVSMAIPSILGGGGSAVNQDFTKSAFNAASINFDDYRQALDKQLNDNIINQSDYNAAIKLLTTHRESINNAPKVDVNNAPVEGSKQLDYAYEDTKIKVYKEKAANSDGVAKEMWESKIKQSEDIQRQILMPAVVAPVAPATVVADEELIVDESPNTLTPQETIVKAVEDEKITGVEADLIKQGAATPDDILLSFAKQKYGVAEDGSIFPEGGRDISMKTSLDVDEAVENVYPNQQSVIDAIKKSQQSTATSNIPASVSVVMPDKNSAPNVVSLPKSTTAVSVTTSGQNRTPDIVPLQTPVSRVSVVSPSDNTAPNVVPLQQPPQPEQPVVDLGTRVQTSEPPAVEGVTPVTLSGLTEVERQARVEKRVQETATTDQQKQTNALLQKVKSYNSLPNGRLGKQRPAGLQQLNNIRLEAQKLGLSFDERAGTLKNANNKTVRPDNREVGDRAIAPNGVVLRDRPQQTQDVFNQLLEAGQFPNGYRLDNKQMSAAEIDGAVQDILDGIPSERANNYLNQLEGYIANDKFEIGNPGELKLAPSLNDLLGVQSETQTQPMTQEALDAWLNEQGELTAEQEQVVIDNFENLIQDYEPAATNESVVQSTESAAATTDSAAVESDTVPVNAQAETTQVAEVAQPEQDDPVDALTKELRALLGNEALPLTGDANPKNRISFADLGVTENDTVESFVDKLIAYGGEFTSILQAIKADSNFKNIKLQLVGSRSGLENGESGLYYPVGYGQDMDSTLQVANKDNVYYTAAHELMHFFTLDGAIANESKGTPAYQAITDMYNYIVDKKGKPVAIAGGATVENYGLTNEKEFMAELLINPAFRKYVGDVFAANREDIFKTSKSIRDSKVNSIGDIIYNFFVDIFNKVFSKPAADVPYNERFSVVQNAAKTAIDLFFGGQDVISIQSRPINEQGAVVLGMGNADVRAAALAFPSTSNNDTINTFVKSALSRGIDEGVLKKALMNNGISESDAQSFIDANKPQPQPAPAAPKSTPQRNEGEIISRVVNQRIDARTFPNIFGENETDQQIAANTQGAGQNREVDGAYVVALEKDLKEVSVQSANVLRNQLGKDWGIKTLDWIENNPGQGNIAQVVGLLNIISTENFQEIQDTHDGARVRKLAAIQRRIDTVSIQRARDASLALRQRILYAKFAQGESMTDVVANSILSPEMQQLQTELNEILSTPPTDQELNSAPVARPAAPKKRTIRSVTGNAKRKSNPSVKDDLISKGAETANKTKKSFKELIEDAKNKLNNVKC